MTPLRLGFIGLGQIARGHHLPALLPLRAEGRVELRAFCDLDEGALREAGAEYGVERLYTDHHAMLERERLDALYVLVPPTLHTDAELIAAEQGIGLFVEKPQTLDLEQARRFLGAIRKAGIVSQVGFMSRYHPAAERAREVLAERILRHASVGLYYSGAPLRYWTSRWELCGGSFVENSIHMVDLLRSFFGDIESAAALYVERRPGDPERGPMNLPHAYLVNFRFRSGAAAAMTTSRCLTGAGITRREVLLVSEGSLLEWSPQRLVENGRVIWECDPAPDPFHLQARAFVEAVRERDPTRVRSPYAEAFNSLAAVLAANASAARGGASVPVESTDGTG